MVRLPVLSVLTLTAVAGAQNVTATVNDSRSHGMLGDAQLSLDEAIQLANGTLAPAALSAQERQQLSGIGTLTTIEVHAATTPTITYERDLTPLTGVPGGAADVELVGIPQNGTFPVLDAGTTNHGVALRTNRVQVRGFDLRGGRVGVDADTTAALTLGVFAIVADVTFTGQIEAGLRARAPNDQPARRILLKVRRCTFDGLPIGVEVRSESDFGRIDIEAEWLTFTACATAIDLDSVAAGGTHQWQAFRTDVTGGDYGVRLRRAVGNDSEWLVRAAYGTWFARRTVFELEGSTTGADTVFHHHQLDVRGGMGSNDYALLTKPANARFDLHSSENVFEGNVLIQSGRPSRRLWYVGNRFVNGTFAITNEGVRPELQWNAFVGTPVTVLSSNTQLVKFLECEFVRSPITDATRSGTTELTGCYQTSSPTSGNVVVQSPAPSGWIADATVAPVDPPRGTFVDLDIDLQPGTGAVWWLGLSEPRPVTTNYPFRYYLYVPTAVVLPFVFTGQGHLRLPIPGDAYLAGVEFHAQPLVAPIAGQTHVPPVSMPRGGRFLVH